MRMTVKLLGVIVALGLLLVAVPALAHHSFAAAFDENHPINLQGTVTKVELVNPHAWIWIDVKGPDGTVTNWGIEGGPPTNLLRNGITKTSLAIGTEIKVFGYRAKSEFVHNPMRKVHRALIAERPISIGHDVSSPEPASVRLDRDLRPEPRSDWGGACPLVHRAILCQRWP